MAIVKGGMYKIWGMNTQGDFAGYTFYTDRFKNLVFFDKAPPLNPGTPLQMVYRNKFRLAALSWNALSMEVRRDWELASQRAHLLCTGYNLWTWWRIKNDRDTIQTVERQTGLRLLDRERE